MRKKSEFTILERAMQTTMFPLFTATIALFTVRCSLFTATDCIVCIL